MDESRSPSRDLDAGASTDDGGGGEEEAGRSKACTECKVVKASTEVRRRRQPAAQPATLTLLTATRSRARK